MKNSLILLTALLLALGLGVEITYSYSRHEYGFAVGSCCLQGGKKYR